MCEQLPQSVVIEGRSANHSDMHRTRPAFSAMPTQSMQDVTSADLRSNHGSRECDECWLVIDQPVCKFALLIAFGAETPRRIAIHSPSHSECRKQRHVLLIEETMFRHILRSGDSCEQKKNRHEDGCFRFHVQCFLEGFNDDHSGTARATRLAASASRPSRPARSHVVAVRSRRRRNPRLDISARSTAAASPRACGSAISSARTSSANSTGNASVCRERRSREYASSARATQDVKIGNARQSTC